MAVILLQSLETDAGHLMVCHAINRGDWISDAIFDFASSGQTEWTPASWQKVLKSLDANTLTIREWIF